MDYLLHTCELQVYIIKIQQILHGVNLDFFLITELLLLLYIN